MKPRKSNLKKKLISAIFYIFLFIISIVIYDMDRAGEFSTPGFLGYAMIFSVLIFVTIKINYKDISNQKS